MVDFIILGEIPGTSVKLGFTSVLIMFLLLGIVYLLRDYEIEVVNHARQTSPYKKFQAKLHHLWLNRLHPKLQLIENEAIRVPEFAALIEYIKSSRQRRKLARLTAGHQ